MWKLWGGRNFGLPTDWAHRLYNSLLLLHKPCKLSENNALLGKCIKHVLILVSMGL